MSHSTVWLKLNQTPAKLDFFSPPNLPNILTKRNDSLMQTYKNPMSHYSPHKIVCTVWSCCRVNHEHEKTSSKSWLIENVTLNCLLFFFPHFSIWPELLCCKLQCPAVCVFTLWATCLTVGTVCVDCRLRGSDYFSKHWLRKYHM